MSSSLLKKEKSFSRSARFSILVIVFLSFWTAFLFLLQKDNPTINLKNYSTRTVTDNTVQQTLEPLLTSSRALSILTKELSLFAKDAYYYSCYSAGKEARGGAFASWICYAYSADLSLIRKYVFDSEGISYREYASVPDLALMPLSIESLADSDLLVQKAVNSGLDLSAQNISFSIGTEALLKNYPGKSVWELKETPFDETNPGRSYFFDGLTGELLKIENN